MMNTIIRIILGKKTGYHIHTIHIRNFRRRSLNPEQRTAHKNASDLPEKVSRKSPWKKRFQDDRLAKVCHQPSNEK